MTRILIADDHDIVRKGLIQILRDEFQDYLIEEASNGEELMKKVRSSNWDLVISDISMPGRSGLEALREIKEYYPRLPVLILSMHPEDQYAIRVLKAGAAGFINKEAAATELAKAVRAVLNGRKYITENIAMRLIDDLGNDENKSPHEALSDQEFIVFKHLAEGKAVSEIAEILHLGVSTIGTYRGRIMEKMKMKTNADITRYALDNKLI